MDKCSKGFSSCCKLLCQSLVSQKFLMALSGLALVGFIITHLLGNLTLLDTSGVAFNTYAKKLHSFGTLTLVAEFALAGLFLFHIVMAVRLKSNYKAARPEGYAMVRSKGGPSKSNVGSRNMIITGAVILAFLIWHVWSMRFGPGIDQGYITNLEGGQARDLYRLVSETFANPLYVALYCGTMILLGFHLRHGFWSMFQSLGLMFPRWSPAIYATALVFALLIAIGFIVLPVFMYLQSGV